MLPKFGFTGPRLTASWRRLSSRVMEFSLDVSMDSQPYFGTFDFSRILLGKCRVSPYPRTVDGLGT
jgi:hypothetical protein